MDARVMFVIFHLFLEMRKIRARALKFLEEKVIIAKEHYVATYLVPGLRLLTGLSDAKREWVHKTVKSMCEELQRRDEERQVEENGESQPDEPATKFFAFPGWHQAVKEVLEAKLYEATGRQDEANPDDVLVWWRLRQTSFPQLARLAKVVFSLPATSCESERVFSTSGNILSTRRSVLGPQRVGDLVFYVHNSKAYPNEEFNIISSEDEECVP